MFFFPQDKKIYTTSRNRLDLPGIISIAVLMMGCSAFFVDNTMSLNNMITSKCCTVRHTTEFRLRHRDFEAVVRRSGLHARQVHSGGLIDGNVRFGICGHGITDGGRKVVHFDGSSLPPRQSCFRLLRAHAGASYTYNHQHAA